MKKKGKKSTNIFAKTQIIESIKIFRCYLNIMFFISNINQTILVDTILKKMFTWASFENHWDLLLGECA